MPRETAVTKQNWYLIDSFWGAFKRHWFFALIVSVPVAVLVGYTLSKWKPEYTSTATIVYDMSKMKEQQNESSLVIGNRVTSAFASKFTDPEFLLRLHDRIDAKVKGDDKGNEAEEKDLKEIILSKVPEAWIPTMWKTTPDPSGRRDKIEDLTARLKTSVAPAQFLMSVTASAKTPEAAQLYASEAMDLYVEEELKKIRTQLGEQLDKLTSLETSTLLEKSDPKDIALTQAFVEEEGVAATEEEKKELKKREQDLIAKILIKTRESVRVQAIQYEREFQLQNELNALLTKRSPAHPDVIQKKEELEKFRREIGTAQIEADITAMKAQLYQMQAMMRAKGIPIDRSVQLNSFSEEVRRFLLDVSNQIRTTELEIQAIEPQLSDNSKWTRYGLIRPAEVPTRAANAAKFFVAIAIGILLVLLSFFFVIFVRELSSPRIVEPRTLAWKYKLPVLTRLSGSTFLDVGRVRKLRARLGELRKKSDRDLELLDSYRVLQQALKADGDPQVICYYDLSHEKVSHHAALNLANVMATDSHERVIYLSFNPANQKYLPKDEGGNLMSFLSGEIDWKACRVKANEDVACDLAVADHPELQLGHFREDLVQRLIKALREKYQRIVIDGLDPVFLSENTMLAKEADVVLVGVALNKSQHQELDRVLSVMPKAKVQGFVVG